MLLANPDVQPGDVDLIAPKGTVNAGDAGIRSAGNLFIAAQTVVGADNIQVGGISVGVPVADTGALSAGVAGASSVGNSASKVAEDATKQIADQAAPNQDTFKQSFLTVEFIGFGE